MFFRCDAVKMHVLSIKSQNYFFVVDVKLNFENATHDSILTPPIGHSGPPRDQEGPVGAYEGPQSLPHRGGEAGRLEPAGDRVDDPGRVSRREARPHRQGLSLP